jgi:CBS domain-containing protein
MTALVYNFGIESCRASWYNIYILSMNIGTGPNHHGTIRGASMNLAFLITPKSEIAFLYDDFSFRQGLEKLRHHGYTSLPVLSRNGRYVGSISEGDFLWSLIDGQSGQLQRVEPKQIEHILIRELLTTDRNPPVSITSSMEEMFIRSTSQNYLPVVDDNDSFVGIVTRKDLLSYFYNQSIAKVLQPELA